MDHRYRSTPLSRTIHQIVTEVSLSPVALSPSFIIQMTSPSLLSR
jgi:hypothetical protein